MNYAVEMTVMYILYACAELGLSEKMSSSARRKREHVYVEKERKRRENAT